MFINILGILLLSVVGGPRPQAVYDPRLLPISRDALIKEIQTTPIDSPMQLRLLSRARYAHLLDVAYREYGKICRDHANNPYANLLLGLAEEDLIMDSSAPWVKPYKDLTSSNTNYLELAYESLQKAHELAPKSSIISAEYGYFLWQYRNRQAEGVALLMSAESSDPANPKIHVLRALVYAYQSHGTDTLDKAITEAQTAIKLDNYYAYPHQILSDIYLQRHQANLKAHEDAAWKALVPGHKAASGT